MMCRFHSTNLTLQSKVNVKYTISFKACDFPLLFRQRFIFSKNIANLVSIKTKAKDNFYDLGFNGQVDSVFRLVTPLISFDRGASYFVQ